MFVLFILAELELLSLVKVECNVLAADVVSMVDTTQKKITIVIVEDEGIVAKDIGRMLDSLDHRVVGVVSSGEAAVEMVEAIRPELVLMDIRLKGDLDGIEAAQRIRSSCDIPVIYMTAHSDEKTLQRAKASKPFGYVLKPIELRELHTTIEIALYRHGLEQKLKKSEVWLSTTLQSISEAVVATDVNGCIVFMNGTAELLTGWTQKEALGISAARIFRLVDEASRAAAENPIEKVLSEGVVVEGANHALLIARDESETSIEHSVAPIRDKDDTIIGVVLVFRNVTERKRAESALRASKESFYNIVDRSVDGVLIIDKDATIRFVNPVAAVYLNCAGDDLIGHPFRYPVVADTVSEIEICTENSMNGIAEMRVAETEWEGRSAYLASLRDITTRKKSEGEQAKLIAELENKNAELERFTYTVSHDLKSPLVTIRGFLDLLEKDIEKADVERLKSDIARIAHAADKMFQLLAEILDLSRVGRVVNKPEHVSLAEISKEAMELVAVQIAERGVEVALSPRLPVVYGDRPRLLEVMQNLIENAVKFIGDQEKPRIEVGAEERGDEYVCFVRDNGIGIEPSYQERVFGLFDKLDADSEGSGIGLALVKRIIEVHRGRIWVESVGAYSGSTFYFALPKNGGMGQDGR